MKTKLINLIKNACAVEEEVTFESELETLSIDSLTFVGLLVEIETTFNIEFNLDELDIKYWKNVEDIYLTLEKKVYAKE